LGGIEFLKKLNLKVIPWDVLFLRKLGIGSKRSNRVAGAKRSTFGNERYSLVN